MLIIPLIDGVFGNFLFYGEFVCRMRISIPVPDFFMCLTLVPNCLLQLTRGELYCKDIKMNAW